MARTLQFISSIGAFIGISTAIAVIAASKSKPAPAVVQHALHQEITTKPTSQPTQPVKEEFRHIFIGHNYKARLQPDEKADSSEVKLNNGDELHPIRQVINSQNIEWIGWDQDGAQVWVPDPLVTHEAFRNLQSGNLPLGEEQVDRWRALSLDYEPDDLTDLPAPLTYDPEHRTCRMRKEAAEQVVSLFEDAKKQGIILKVVSAFRPANIQRDLYLRRISLSGYAQETVAKPGHSEHQLGTAMDINGEDPKTVVEQSFGATKEGEWVRENCQKYGFIISYTEENKTQTGYAAEPWHLRYIGAERIPAWKPLGPVAFFK